MDRIFTETWISYGESNCDRIEMKTRLNHPLQYYFSLPTLGTMALIHKNTKNTKNTKNRKKIELGRSLGGGASFPNNIHLQSLRVLPNGGGILVRLQHLYSSELYGGLEWLLGLEAIHHIDEESLFEIIREMSSFSGRQCDGYVTLRDFRASFTPNNTTFVGDITNSPFKRPSGIPTVNLQMFQLQ